MGRGSVNMLQEKNVNQVFKERIDILEGAPVFENCIFEKGVYIEGNNKRYFHEGVVPHPVFKSCKFRSQGSEHSVALWTRAQGDFIDCQMSAESYVPVRIDTGSHGVFRDCSVSYNSDRCGVAIMIAASGDFENCRFCNFGERGSATKIEPVYFDAHDKEKTRFENCLFSETAKNSENNCP